jgi:hypothetical protein
MNEEAAALDSSGSFDRPASAGSVNHRPAFTDRGRFRGCRGGVITMHRALTRLVLTPLDLVKAALLMLVLSFAWIVSLPWLCGMWSYLLGNGMRILALHTTLGLTEHHITRYIRFLIPYPRMEGIAPSAWTWWSTAAVVCLLYAASYFFPKTITPVTYLVRAALFVQSTALLYFLLAAARFPHTPDSYMEGLISYQIALISAVPALFGLTYYIFKFSLSRKIALTVLTMSHLFLFLPVQILLQAAVLEKSVLFMPILYIVFGLPVNILIILAFYSWGMSWPSDGNVKKRTIAYRSGSPQSSGSATSRFAQGS